MCFGLWFGCLRCAFGGLVFGGDVGGFLYGGFSGWILLVWFVMCFEFILVCGCCFGYFALVVGYLGEFSLLIVLACNW